MDPTYDVYDWVFFAQPSEEKAFWSSTTNDADCAVMDDKLFGPAGWNISSKCTPFRTFLWPSAFPLENAQFELFSEFSMTYEEVTSSFLLRSILAEEPTEQAREQLLQWTGNHWAVIEAAKMRKP